MTKRAQNKLKRRIGLNLYPGYFPENLRNKTTAIGRKSNPSIRPVESFYSIYLAPQIFRDFEGSY